VIAPDFCESFERKPGSFAHPRSQYDFVAEDGRRFIVDLMSQDNPGDVLLGVRAGDRSPMSGSNILDPSQVNGVVYVILLVDIAWQHRNDHFERHGGHRRIREKLKYEFENGMDGESAYMKSSHQFLPGLHRELWIHAAENFFTALLIHGCQVADQFVARSPFRILAQTDADRQKRGDDPNSDVCRGHERIKKQNVLATTQQLLSNCLLPGLSQPSRLAQTEGARNR